MGLGWSIPFSETIGGVIGTAAGYVASEYVKSKIENSNMNSGTKKALKPLASAVTATTAHLIAGGTTKAAINAVMLDGTGGCVTPFSTSATALTHGIVELGNGFAKEFSKKATSEALKYSYKKK